MKKLLLLASLLLALSVARVNAGTLPTHLYSCGWFNGWDVYDCIEFAQGGSEGVFTAEIDFSSAREFKISTNRIDGSMEFADAWAYFDEGAYVPTSQPVVNTPCPIIAGDQNISAPSSDRLTVIVDFQEMTITFSDGTGVVPDPDPTPKSNLHCCGQFNGWNVLTCIDFEEVDGVYSHTFAFSEGELFKITTSDLSVATSTQDAWALFDEGAYQLMAEPKVNVPCPIAPGTDNIAAPAAGVLTVIVDLNNKTLTFTDGGEIKPDVPWSGTLPVLHIETDGHAPILSKEDYVSATYWLDPLDIEGVEAFGSEAEPLTLQIKGRGNYSWTGFDKKPYRLKLKDKAALLGMKKSKHFAILAHADDTFGFLRNPVGFKLSEMIDMPWTPAQQPVEVMLNGEYQGLYFLTETIRVDKDRVNIVEQPDNATDPEVITGGWLVEIDNYDTDPHVTLIEPYDYGYPIWFTYKTPEVLSSQQENYLTDQMSLINDLIYGDKNSAELWKHVDMDLLARYYIVQEIVDDYESFHGSCYLYKQQGNDEKWKFGPVWDFGNAFYRNKEQYIFQGLVWHNVWIEEVCKFPAFMDRVKDIWTAFTADKFSGIYDYVDSYVDKIATACVYDARRWPSYGHPDEPRFKAVVNNYLANSRTWLCSKWGGSSSAKVMESPVFKVKAAAGAIVIDAPEAAVVTLVTVDGRSRRVSLREGTNTIETAPGFYIIAGQKVIVK